MRKISEEIMVKIFPNLTKDLSWKQPNCPPPNGPENCPPVRQWITERGRVHGRDGCPAIKGSGVDGPGVHCGERALWSSAFQGGFHSECVKSRQPVPVPAHLQDVPKQELWGKARNLPGVLRARLGLTLTAALLGRPPYVGNPPQ